MGRLSGLCFLMIALAMAIPASAQPINQRLAITTASGSHPFEIELVRSPADMEKGLMFRHTMAPDHGMLFDFGSPQSISMWMKNTYLPLDMVFIASDGHVLRVAENAKPMSEEIIPSDGPALGVLELNAGVAAKIGLKPGDTVQASIFPK